MWHDVTQYIEAPPRHCNERINETLYAQNVLSIKLSDCAIPFYRISIIFHILYVRLDSILTGFVHAISTGSWVLKRFRMDRAGKECTAHMACLLDTCQLPLNHLDQLFYSTLFCLSTLYFDSNLTYCHHKSFCLP